MFYSHQLLSKKGPLGHIWMAATMRNKLTRKRAESLDIQELCMQVLHPQVPLALRLSGILMGGIVTVYNRKVTFLYDDVQQLLSKVQVAIAEEKRGSGSVDLPRSKLFAKFQTITIDYTFENFDDIEQLLLRPDTPLQDGDPEVLFEEETIVLPKRCRSNALENFSENGDEYRYAGAHQAHNADITLQEDLPCYAELNDRDFEDERFAPVDDFFQDFQFPDYVMPEPVPSGVVEDYNEVPMGTSEGRASGDLPAGTADATDPEGSSDTPVNAPVGSTEDNATQDNPAEEHIPPELPEVAPKSPEPQSVPPRSRKRRARNTSRILDFDNGTTIPADTLRVWLQDASDLVGRESALKTTLEQTHFETLLRLPSTGLTWRSCTDEPQSLWPPCLLDLWTLNIRGRLKPRVAEREDKNRSPSHGIHEDQDIGKPVPVKTAGRQGSEPENELSGSHDSNMQPPAEEPTKQIHQDQDIGKPVPVSTAGRQGSEPENELSGSHDSNMQPPAEEPTRQGAPAAEVAEVLEATVLKVPTDLEKFEDYGSVEKLRQALHTPASQDDTGNEMGFTPSVSGSHEEGQGSGWSKRRRSTPVSAGLKLDPDIELPTSERSKDSKRQRRSYIFGKSDSPAIPSDNNAPDFRIPSNELDSLAMPGSLSQFELQVDTNPPTQVTNPKQSMDAVTTQLVQFLKDHFHAANAPRWQSVNELTKGLEKFQAAKLFYQITVLTSNRYLITQQDEPYGDILIAPGQYL